MPSLVTLFLYYTDPDKGGIHIISFFFLNENIGSGYSLEAPRGASNENPQPMFSWRNKKNNSTFLVLKSALSGVDWLQSPVSSD